ncbi:MAG TPA: TonB C-terminal domain-containing protein [Syntrophorhabdales bacterium]|nr:TonB C-terminal domain-containing protein [Syntrophorhabdales bacterium]
MKPKKKKSSSQTYIVTGAVLLIFLLLAGGILYLVSTDSGGGKKVFIAKVDIVRPNALDKPPPPPKEKLPEPEVQKKETIVAPDLTQQQTSSAKGDDKPAADGPLGLDAQGGAGSDGFGLAARKGGRDVTTLGTGPKVGGGRDLATLLRQYAPYTRLVEEDVNKLVRRRLEENGGIPKGKLEALAEIIVGDKGDIRQFKIIRPSGNRSMDEAVKESLKFARISQPLPEGCPRAMNIKIMSQG